MVALTRRGGRYVAAPADTFRAGPFHAWHTEALAEVAPFMAAICNKTVAALRERRPVRQQDHLAQAARALRNLCGRQLLSPAGRAHHAATVAVVPNWVAWIDRARHDAMAEFWHCCHLAFMLNIRLIVTRSPTPGHPNGTLLKHPQRPFDAVPVCFRRIN